MSSNINDLLKIPNVQNSKAFALWRFYLTEHLHHDEVLYVLSEGAADPVLSTLEVQQRWEEDDRKARPHFFLNLGEEPATLVTSLFISNAQTKEVWNLLCGTYHQENIQLQLNLRNKLHNLQLSDNGNIHHHLLQLEEIFVDLARINDPVLEKDKTGILLRSLLKSLSFFPVIVQVNNMRYTDLCALLNSEAERRSSVRPVNDGVPPIQPSACMAKMNQKGGHLSKNRTSVTCWNCRKRGHIQANVACVVDTTGIIYSSLTVKASAVEITTNDAISLMKTAATNSTKKQTSAK